MAKGIPVLMYHKVSPNRKAGRAEKLRVAPEKFDREMGRLFAHGYRTVTVGDLVAFCEGQLILPERRMIVSFDDGYRDNFLYAFPILRKYNFTAVVFLVSGCIGLTSEWDEAGPEPLLNWEDIKEMNRAGVEFGSHGWNHRLLPSLSTVQIREEVTRSKAVIEDRLGCSINFFSYPWGKFDRRAKEIVEESGYKAAFSTLPGKNRPGEDVFTLRRILIRGYDTRFYFFLNLKFGRSRI